MSRGAEGSGALPPILNRSAHDAQDSGQLNVVLSRGGLGRPGRGRHTLEHGTFSAAQDTAALNALGGICKITCQQLAGEIRREVHSMQTQSTK